jgi:hypothetical protein
MPRTPAQQRKDTERRQTSRAQTVNAKNIEEARKAAAARHSRDYRARQRAATGAATAVTPVASSLSTNRHPQVVGTPSQAFRRNLFAPQTALPRMNLNGGATDEIVELRKNTNQAIVELGATLGATLSSTLGEFLLQNAEEGCDAITLANAQLTGAE